MFQCGSDKNVTFSYIIDASLICLRTSFNNILIDNQTLIVRIIKMINCFISMFVFRVPIRHELIIGFKIYHSVIKSQCHHNFLLMLTKHYVVVVLLFDASLYYSISLNILGTLISRIFTLPIQFMNQKFALFVCIYPVWFSRLQDLYFPLKSLLSAECTHQCFCNIWAFLFKTWRENLFSTCHISYIKHCRHITNPNVCSFFKFCCCRSCTVLLQQ